MKGQNTIINSFARPSTLLVYTSKIMMGVEGFMFVLIVVRVDRCHRATIPRKVHRLLIEDGKMVVRERSGEHD